MFRIAMVKEAILTWEELYFVVIICLKNQLRWHFFIQQEKKEKKKKIIFGVFWCGIMNIHNEKLVHDA